MKHPAISRPGRIAAASALLVLFGLGAGHLAPRALGASTSIVPASAVLGDSTDSGQACDLKSDGLGAYLDGQDCVRNYVTDGGNLWRMVTPNSGGCSLRNYTLVLFGSSPTFGCSVPPDSALGYPQSPALELCGGSNQVYGQVQATGVFTSKRASTAVFFRMDPTVVASGGNIEFELAYQQYLRVIGSSDGKSAIVTTDGAGASAKLYQRYLKSNGQPDWREIGTFDVPCKITVTKLQ